MNRVGGSHTSSYDVVVEQIFVDDMMMRVDGLENLTHQELRDAVEARY